jgi:GNAT superfamily N-acetyltransferase
MTTRKIRLRKVRDTDADDLAQAWRDQSMVYAALAPDVFGVPSGDGLGAWLVDGLASQADPDRRLVLVADIDGRAVGFLVAAVVAAHAAADRQMQRALSRPRVQIEALAVQRAHWRGGVGRRLLVAAEDWARNRGATEISAQAYIEGPAQPFLGALGYTPQAAVLGKRLSPVQSPDDATGNNP